ncbi:MAG TPA: sigma-54 dependent transcriptional regulator [Gammaproteobacteria bacterium]|nr:sigma-54 dependent transcriptional regulator [Gammaproteobacteria bacterium]
MGSSILVVDDESDIRRLLKEILSEEGYDVAVAADAAEARVSWEQLDPDLVLLDIWMPGTDGITLLRERAEKSGLHCPVVMMSGHGTVDTAVEATRLGAFDFVEKPLSLAKLLRTVESALSSGRAGKAATARSLVPALIPPVGKSRAMRELRERVQRVAPHATAVLITGEAGTGREAFARYLHSLSPRAAEPFVVLVAGALTGDNAATQILGSENGGVVAGCLERARGGVLFINELQDLLPDAQRLLAGVLEQGRFTRAGGRDAIALDTRFVSSAQPGFEEAFRRDLLAHLSVVKLRIPPLREYAEDVPELLRYYVDMLVDVEGLPFRRFDVAAQNRLRNYPWPGNIRDLKNVVHRLLIMGGDSDITLREIERELEIEAPADEPLVKQDLLSLPLREAREHFERAYLQQQLQLCDGKVGALAKRVGMERTHLYRKLRSLGVEFRQTGDE